MLHVCSSESVSWTWLGLDGVSNLGSPGVRLLGMQQPAAALAHEIHEFSNIWEDFVRQTVTSVLKGEKTKTQKKRVTWCQSHTQDKIATKHGGNQTQKLVSWALFVE